MKINRKIIKSSILTLTFLFLLITFSITYAWYTDTTQIGKIDAETKDITFAYRINGSEENIQSYSVKNLAFFDVDNEKELKYFKTILRKNYDT